MSTRRAGKSMMVPAALLVLLGAAGCSGVWNSVTGTDTGSSDSSAAAPVTLQSTPSSSGRSSVNSVAGMGGTPSGGTPHDFAVLPDRGDLVGYLQPRVVRQEGAYIWHRADISEAHALAAIVGGELSITTPSGMPLKFRYQRHVEHPSGDWSWIGRMVGGRPGEEALLTFGANAVFGSISQPGELPLRLISKDGVSWLIETDRALLAGVENAATNPGTPDFLVAPSLALNAAESGGTGPAAQALPSSPSSGAPLVDLVLGYTPGFSAYWGGTSQAVTRLHNIVDVTNQAYVNSQINGRLRLVGTLQVDYADTTSNDTVLQALTGSDGKNNVSIPASLQPLRTARDTYGADLVSLVRKFNEPENGGCGIAWLLGGGQSNITAGHERFGYSVVSDGQDQGADGKTYFCREETLAHEIGHNMGGAHDIETAKGDDGVLQADEYGRFSYSFGYKTGAGAGNFYTIMAYGDKGGAQTSYRVFSNPRITLCGGFQCGTSQADNASTLNQTIPMIATFRDTVVPVASRVRHDMNGDGKSDLLFVNMGAERSAYWTMSGSTIAGYSNVFVDPAGYERVATGDFNGDGIGDIVWARASDRALLLWQGGGGGFSLLAMPSHAEGWAVTGAGDVDGDGRSDLLLANAASRLTAFWVMNGASPSRYSPTFAEPAGYDRVATGDFNGDGLLDIIWRRATDRHLLAWTGTGTGFIQQAIGNHTIGWTIGAAGDIDGDGRSDLVLTNAALGRTAYWIMNGVSVARFSAVFVNPENYQLVENADFNGDGKLDLVWARQGDRHLLLWQGDGIGFNPISIGFHSAGWQVSARSKYDYRSRASGDVDGDGRSDFVLASSDLGRLAYWTMAGAAPVRYSDVFYAPSGYERVAKGDFNGDGRLDVVWARASDRHLLLWQGDGIGFKPIPIGNYSAGWEVGGAGDIDGDGRSDLILANAAAERTAYWIMSGATPVRYSAVFENPVGYARSVSGDFNGDGRLDIVWVRPADRHLLLWQGNGVGFSVMPIGNHSQGWVVSSAGDVDGDGRSDLVLINASQGQSAYWIMSGPTPIAYSNVFVNPSAYQQVTRGDYDGNGKLDLVWVRSGDRHILQWQGEGTGFNPIQVGVHSPGWAIVD